MAQNQHETSCGLPAGDAVSFQPPERRQSVLGYIASYDYGSSFDFRETDRIGLILLRGYFMELTSKLAFRLMMSILEVIKESGAKREEAIAALQAAEAMLPEIELSNRPDIFIQTRPRA